MRRIGWALVAAVVVGAAGLTAGADGPVLEFQPTGSLQDGGRDSHAAVLLADGRVLVVGGWHANHLTAKGSAETYDPASESWSLTGSLTTARTYLTASLLPDGRVLVCGGMDGAPVYETTELYDPATGAFSAGAPMSVARQLHRAVTLADGRILVAGGTDSSGSPTALDSAEIYDPSTETWSATGAMTIGRNVCAAVLLEDGRVLVAGGASGAGDSTATCEIYDPATESFSAAASMERPRAYAGATRLDDGRVLVAGGSTGGTNWDDAELYDPATDTWAPAGTLTAGGQTVTLTLLEDGRVLAAGGFGSDVEMDADLFDPVAEAFAPIGPMGAGRHYHSAIRLLDGTVLLAGGAETLTGAGPYGGSTAELFGPFGAVVDTTPPVISAVSDVHADATSTAGAVVTFASPTATDAVDGDVEVTCVPASGSLFEVGITEVTCSATDASGNTAVVAFDVIVRINPQYLKGAVADALNALLPTGDKKNDKLILKAILDIEEGLAPEHWQDETHLSAAGRAAFREDGQAIQHLSSIVDPPAAILQAIADLVASDRALAETAIADATATAPDSPHLVDAAAEMDLAADSLASGEPADAVRHYRKAWKWALKASGLL
jgi:hypothetical protein